MIERKPPVILAIDPGLDGAYAIYWPETRNLVTASIPTMGEGKRREINCPELSREIRGHSIAFAVVERVHSMPKQGIASTFRFGQAYGAALACVQAWSIPLHSVTPQVWKKFHGLTGGSKEDSRQLAIRLFPAFAHQYRQVKDHNRAEAALLALWGARVHYLPSQYREAAE